MNPQKRSKDDLEWVALKEKVIKRDKSKCRLSSILSLKEHLLLMKCGPLKMLRTLDPAHVFSVSTHPELCYEELNVVTLNRFSHTCLDNGLSPITGHIITREESIGWWKKIVSNEVYSILEKKLHEVRYGRNNPGTNKESDS
jgi:hypothetical protein